MSDISTGSQDDCETSLAPTSVAKFRATVADYSFCTELPVLERSSGRTPVSRKRDRLLLLDEEEVDGRGNISKFRKSKNGDSKSSPKKKKLKRGYAAPERYAHLKELPDILAPELDVLFCGINPGEYSATVGHHFSNPRNHFWHCLRDSGFTGEEFIQAADDHRLPKSFSLGLTNLVHRPTAEQNELANTEFKAGVPAFLLKVAKYRPHVVCFVGLGIAKTVKFYCLPKLIDGKGTTTVGLQPYKVVHIKDEEFTVQETLFFAIPSTSGRVVQFQREDKVKFMKELREKLVPIKSGEFDTDSLHPITTDLLSNAIKI